MKTSEFRSGVYRTLSIKPAKAGIRQAIRTKRSLNTSHAIIGFKTETGELLQGLQPYLFGQQLTPTLLVNAREELGDCFYYLTVLARELKVKMPASTKRVKLKNTITHNILELDVTATLLLDVFKKAMYGHQINTELAAQYVAEAIQLAYGLTFQLFHEPPATIFAENQAKLLARYPTGFSPEQEAARNLKAEAKAAKVAGSTIKKAIAKAKPLNLGKKAPKPKQSSSVTA